MKWLNKCGSDGSVSPEFPGGFKAIHFRIEIKYIEISKFGKPLSRQ